MGTTPDNELARRLGRTRSAIHQEWPSAAVGPAGTLWPWRWVGGLGFIAPLVVLAGFLLPGVRRQGRDALAETSAVRQRWVFPAFPLQGRFFNLPF